MTDFYTYIYHDNTVPIYVGKGKEGRAYIHLKKCHNGHLKNKLAKMKREGREPRIQIIDAPDEAAAFEMEELLISMIGRRDLGTGSLLNLTDGGDGASGLIHTMETKTKISAMGGRNSKPCTIDGVIIYPSYTALVKVLGQGKNGHRHPDFRYV